jgi:hypothetical protein
VIEPLHTYINWSGGIIQYKKRRVGFFFCSTQKLHQANLARFFFLRIPNLSRWTELTEMELRPVVYI